MEASWKAVLFKRILPGLILIGLGFFGLTYSQGGESQLAVMGRALLAIPFLLIGAMFLARPLASAVAAPLVGLLYPEDHDYSPPPLYRLPEMYIRQGRHQEAVWEYQKIVRYHPGEIRAYLALLEVAYEHLQDPVLAEKTYKTGLRRLKQPADRARLEETFQSLHAGAPLASSSIESYP